MSKEGKDILKNNMDSDFEMFFDASSKIQAPPSKLGKEATWDKLLQSIENEEVKETKVISMPSRIMWISIAASLLVLFTIISINYKYSVIEIVSPKGSFADVILPDSSEIKLNADSQIKYRKYGWLSNREVSLSGEAYFSVKHGNKFIVLTENERKIVVTGTKFNVFARGNQFEVKCYEGSVRVESPKSKPISLAKGKGINLNKTEELLEIMLEDSMITPKWVNGDFYFYDRSFKEVLDEISRQFNITIIPVDFSAESRNYTGFFNRSNLIQALDLACIPMGFTYQLSSDSTSVRINKRQ